MTQYNFTTNIEHRMPTTGKVFCIDRMTSDYAEAHPLDVDAFIESVYQEFAGTEFEESREVLRSIWTAVLSVTSPCGDASLYPNKNGAKRAAAMKVWAKAGDYWRRGLRLGDTIPHMEPMTKITRLDDGGWIALFPKDMPLLQSQPEPAANVESVAVPQQPAEPPAEPPVRNQSEPQQLDLFAKLQQETDALHARIAEMERQEQAHQENRNSTERQHNEQPEWKRKLEEQWHASHPCENSYIKHASNHERLKTVGMVAAASAAILVVWQTGLVIPIGLIGLATSGLLK